MGVFTQHMAHEVRSQGDGNKCHQEGPERNPALGRKVGSLGASDGVTPDPGGCRADSGTISSIGTVLLLYSV